MNREDSNGFRVLMVGAAEVYGRQISDQLISVYWKVLEQYQFDDVARGFNRHLENPDTGQFWPKPGDIIRHIGGDTGTQALAAWTRVSNAVRWHGSWASVDFADDKIHATIRDMGGWIKICETEEKELPFIRNQFCKRFQAYVVNPPMETPPALIGREESGNASLGFQKPHMTQIAGGSTTAKLENKNGQGDTQV